MELVQTGHSRSSWTLVAGVIAVGPTILLALLLLLLPLTTLLLALRDLLFEEENSEWRWGWRTWWCGCWSCWCGCWWWWISSSSKSDDETHSMLSKSIFLLQTHPPKPIPTFQNLKFKLKIWTLCVCVCACFSFFASSFYFSLFWFLKEILRDGKDWEGDEMEGIEL